MPIDLYTAGNTATTASATGETIFRNLYNLKEKTHTPTSRIYQTCDSDAYSTTVTSSFYDYEKRLWWRESNSTTSDCNSYIRFASSDDYTVRATADSFIRFVDNCVSGTCTITSDGWIPIRTDPRLKMREMIAARQAPEIIICNNDRRKPLGNTDDPRELRARETLLNIIGVEQFRRYLKNGFVAAAGQSGRIYQLFPKAHLARIFEQGRAIGQCCIYMSGGFTPTDALITWYFMVMTDEKEFLSLGNTSMYDEGRKLPVRKVAQVNNDLTLAQIYQDIKSGKRIQLAA